MSVIWKFPCPLNGGEPTLHSVPQMGCIRHVGIDPASGHPALWIEVDPTAPKVDLRFRVFGTGHEIDDRQCFYKGTVIDGAYVWHIYQWIGA